MKAIQIAALAGLVLAAAALAGIGRPETAGGADADQRLGITVTGTGRVDSVPNEAMFSLGVSTDGATAREALAANSAAMRRVLAALDGAGVDAKDVKTETVSVGPDYEVDGTGPSGFAARNSVSVRIRDLAKAGSVLDAASRAGANEVNGPMLTRTNRDELEAKALGDAVANARKRAGALAAAAGVELGSVTAIVEGFSGGPEPLMEARASADVASVAPIRPGTEEIQATVTVTFAIE
jgi:uncharacterized protein YggE